MSEIQIYDIRWERAILKLYFTSDGGDDALYLYRVKEKRFVPFSVEEEGDHKVASLNVAIAGAREPLSKGRWIIARKIDESLLTDLDTLLEAKPYLLMRMERDARRFHKKELKQARALDKEEALRESPGEEEFWRENPEEEEADSVDGADDSGEESFASDMRSRREYRKEYLYGGNQTLPRENSGLREKAEGSEENQGEAAGIFTDLDSAGKEETEAVGASAGNNGQKTAGCEAEPDTPGTEEEKLLREIIRQEGLSYIEENPYDTHGISYTEEILCDLDRYSRLFRYAKSKYAYAVWFAVRTTSEKTLSLDLHAEFYIRNETPRTRQKSRRGKQKKLLAKCYRIIAFFARRKGNRVLFFKQNGDQPTENMEAVRSRLYERGLDSEYQISCRCRNVFTGKQKLIPWLKDMFAIAKSDYIFIDDYTPIFNFIELDEDVILTQIWHAGVGFKSVGYARFGLSGSPDPYASSHRHYTYALIGNEHLRDIYSEVFGIEPQALLATGMPRLDHFLDEETAQAAKTDLYERYPQLKNGRVILFAPTFRGTGQRSAHYPYEFLDVEALHKMCVETNSYFVYEMHHFIKKRPPIEEQYQDRVLDLTDENLNELFHIGDVLITDYSSCFYDYLLLKKPVILYIPDRINYIATRGIQRPIEAMAPGEICETFESLLESLYTKRYETVQPKALTIDRAAERGMLASDRVIDTILLKRDVPGVRMEEEGGETET